jgi:hypothetical protein
MGQDLQTIPFCATGPCGLVRGVCGVPRQNRPALSASASMGAPHGRCQVGPSGWTHTHLGVRHYYATEKLQQPSAKFPPSADRTRPETIYT